MNRLLAATLLALTVPAFAEDPPTQAEINGLMAKMKSGQPLTADEQRRVQEWAAARSRQADPNEKNKVTFDPGNTPSGVPDDVQAIMRKLKETGERPTAEELARLKAWSAAAKGQKQAIVDDAKKKEAELEASKPPPDPNHPPPKTNALYPDGWAIFGFELTSASTDRGSSSTYLLTGTVRVPVVFHLNDPMPLKFTNLVKDTFSVTFMGGKKKPSGTLLSKWSTQRPGSSDVGTFSGQLSDGTATGELVSIPGAPRPYLIVNSAVMGKVHAVNRHTDDRGTTTQEGDEQVGAPVLTVDNLRTDVPWTAPGGINSAMAQAYGVEQKLSPDVKALRDSGSFTFDTDALKKGLNGSGQRIFQGKYGWRGHFRDAHYDGEVSAKIDVTFQIGDLDVDPELVVDLGAGFDQWMPEGGDNTSTPGKTLNVHAQVRDKNGNALPPGKRPNRIQLALSDVSTLPGVCNNWPLDAPDDGSKDYKFPKAMNPKLSGDEQTGYIAVQNEGDSAEAVLAAYDSGGWATLTVKAELKDGSWLVGHLRGKPEGKPILVPDRDASRHTARAFDSSGKDDDDKEQLEHNDKKGDGYSLFEEYRGWKGKNGLERGKPDRMDLVVENKWSHDPQKAYGLLESAAQIHVIALKDGQLREDRIANKNTDKHHLGDQHGLRVIGIAMIDNGKPDTQTCGQDPGSFEAGQQLTPKDTDTVQMNTSYQYTADGTPEIQDMECLAHELGHGVGMMHHGAKATNESYVRQDVKEGAWKAQYFDSEGVPLKAADMAGRFDKEGGPQGKLEKMGTTCTGSGNLTCIMSYNNWFNWGYVRDSGKRVIKFYSVPGVSRYATVCTRPEGTGMNDTSRKIHFFDNADPSFTPCIKHIQLKSY